VDIPYATKYLAGTVGAGGFPGKGTEPWRVKPIPGDYWGGANGLKGTDTTVVGSGFLTLTSVGGAGGFDLSTVFGQALADLSFNGKNYAGAQEEHTPGNQGNHPGGGGAGGWPLIGNGGQGGDGQLWIRAYGWSGS
jgi:hypothetical protein